MTELEDLRKELDDLLKEAADLDARIITIQKRLNKAHRLEYQFSLKKYLDLSASKG